MLTYLVRRLLIGMFTLVLITFVIYALVRHMPGNPATAQIAQIDPSKVWSPEDEARLYKAFGLDKPWYQAYFQWLGSLMHGDMGNSFSRKQPVARIISERIGPTLWLSLSSLVLAYLLSIPLGLYLTARSGKTSERVASTLLYMLYSLPVFVAALLLQMFFAVKLEGTDFALPLFGMKSDGYEQLSTLGKVWDLVKHSILPVFCYTYGSLAYESRFIRSNMQEVIRQDYIRTARAKGVGPVGVLWRHAFRNTLIPFVTLIGLTLPTLLSGSIVIEQIFDWPGIGRLFFESIRERDYPTTMGLTLIFSLMTLVAQLLADFLYTIVDPRVTYS